MSALTLDADHRAALKQQVRESWDDAADGWSAHHALVRAWLSEATTAMLDAAEVDVGMHVLDVAAGAGDQTIDIAKRIGPSGHVVAVDLSARLVALARKNLAAAEISNASAEVADGEALGMASTFDAAVCRLGLMFYADPFKGLSEIRRALKTGRRAAVLAFAGPQGNPLLTQTMKLLSHRVGIAPPDPFQPAGLMSLGAPGTLYDMFLRAGFIDVTVRFLQAPMRLQSARAYIDFVKASAAPIQILANRLAPSERDAFWSELESAMAVFATDQGWVGPNELLLASGAAE
jgi:ubiquinone/menaquinone biosynthesis C-methylase UbiE